LVGTQVGDAITVFNDANILSIRGMPFSNAVSPSSAHPSHKTL